MSSRKLILFVGVIVWLALAILATDSTSTRPAAAKEPRPSISISDPVFTAGAGAATGTLSVINETGDPPTTVTVETAEVVISAQPGGGDWEAIPGSTTFTPALDAGTVLPAGSTTDFSFTSTYSIPVGTTEIRVEIRIKLGGRLKVFSSMSSDSVGLVLAAGEGATIEGEGGISITVEPNSIPYEVLIDIAPAPLSDVAAPVGDLVPAGAVEVIFQPTNFNASFPPPDAPLQISIPAPAGAPAGSDFVVGQQVLTDSVAGSEPGLSEQLVAVDTASLVDGNIITHPHLFFGIFGPGLFVFLFQPADFGFATGIVSDATGSRPGAVVSNSTNTLVSITDASGSYTLPITGSAGGPFTVTGFDPFRGSSGSGSGSIPAIDATVAANIFLSALPAPAPTRDGIRNGGFERCALSSWQTTGAASARQQLGPTSTGVIIQPTEGRCMADINTGLGAVGGTGSSLKQRFIVPAGVQTLRLDFNFVSEEFPEFVGTIFNDAFRARITTPSGDTTFAQVSVNQSGGFTLIGNCFFPGGDSTCGQTGWREGSVNLSAFSGTNTPVTVELLFTANDAGDNIYDTHVLIDNIRFATVFIDVNIIQGANAGLPRVENEVRAANEILSQAGINVRIRNVQTIADPGGLLDTDITWTYTCTLFIVNCGGVRTAEEIQLLTLSRSATTTDVNVYYVRSFTGAGACAIAIGPDDFRSGLFSRVDIFTESGTIQGNVGSGCAATGHILAHELGHLLISPQKAGDALEHAAGTSNFLGGNGGSPLSGIVSRQQSANINRAGAPLLAP